MPSAAASAREILTRLHDVMAGRQPAQAKLNQVVGIIGEAIDSEVCSIYLLRDGVLELFATRGLAQEAVHVTKLALGEGLVGRVARTGRAINTANAPAEPGFRYMPETGEEVFPSFLGVPIQRVGEKLGVLVVQSRDARQYSEDEIYGLEVVAMVLAEMAELGAFLGSDAQKSAHRLPVAFRGVTGQEGAAAGRVFLH